MSLNSRVAASLSVWRAVQRTECGCDAGWRQHRGWVRVIRAVLGRKRGLVAARRGKRRELEQHRA